MAMVDIAQHQDADKPISLADIAVRQNLPLAYLEQLFVKLRKNNLVKSARGQKGGYLLCGDAHQIKISDVIAAVEEPVKSTQCKSTSEQGCQGIKAKCLTHHLWVGLEERILHYLDSVSLADVYLKNIPKTHVPFANHSTPTSIKAIG